MLAEQYVPSGLSALVVALVPLWIALVESALPDMQRPSRLGWLGLLVGFSGLGILLWPRLVGLSAGTSELLGIGIQILATWLWTAGSVYSKRNPVKVDGFVVTAYEMLVAGAVTLVIGTALGEWSSFTLVPKGMAAIAYLSVVGSCVAFTAFIYALSHLPASKVMTYAYVNPVIAVFVGWFAGQLGIVPPEPVTALDAPRHGRDRGRRRAHDRCADASSTKTADRARRRAARIGAPRRTGTERGLGPPSSLHIVSMLIPCETPRLMSGTRGEGGSPTGRVREEVTMTGVHLLLPFAVLAPLAGSPTDWNPAADRPRTLRDASALCSRSPSVCAMVRSAAKTTGV